MAIVLSSYNLYQRPFIITVKTDNEGTSSSNQFTIPVTGAGYNYYVDWGDGTTSSNITWSVTKTYASAGVYDIKIKGVFPRIYFNNTGDRLKLLDIKQWGDIIWNSMNRSFWGCSNLNYLSATDSPNLQQVLNLNSMFNSATSFNGNLSNWNVSNVTNMGAAFSGATTFNSNLSNWDVSKVTNMNSMFANAISFNSNLSNWDVSKVTDMRFTFLGARSFNSNLSSWNVSNVTDMLSMFANAVSFNSNLSNWCVTNISTAPDNFAFNTPAWTLPKPIWGTCPTL